MKFLLSIGPSAGDAAGGFSFFSLPLPRGRFSGVLEGMVANTPMDLWPLAFWPDGSVRMVQGLIRRSSAEVELEVRPASRPPFEGNAVIGESFSFGGHRLKWLPDRQMFELSFDGRVYFDPERFSQEFSVRRGVTEKCRVESIRVVHQRRQWMRMEAYLGAEAGLLRFRIQWDLFEGVPGCVFSVMVINDTPGIPAVTVESITSHFVLGGEAVRNGVHQKKFGYEQTLSRCVEVTESIEVRVDGLIYTPRVINFEALGDKNVYGAHLKPPPSDVSPIFWLNDGRTRVIYEVENMPFYRPKGVGLADGVFSFGIWPEWADPVSWPQGRRRQMRVAIAIQDGGSEPEFGSISALTSALLDTNRVQLHPEVYRNAHFFDLPYLPPFRPDRNPCIEGWLEAISKLQTIPEFFNFGDTPDSGYRRTYYPLGRVPSRKGDVGPAPELIVTSGRQPKAGDEMAGREFVYVNNEYDVLHCLASEHLRSANALLFKQLGWFARHTIEVDFFCHCDVESLHRAQGVHSADHTTTGAYPSHFWTQGLVQYYFLTGDDDALEVIRALADKTIWYFEHPQLGKLGSGINREMGWAVLTLVSSYEATLESRYLNYARTLIDGVIAEPLPEDLPVFSFGHTSLLLGCKAYIEVLERGGEAQPVIDWYLELVRLAVRSAWYPPRKSGPVGSKPKLSYDFELLEKGQMGSRQARSGVMTGYAALACLAYAWRLSGNREFCEAGLRTARAFFNEIPGYFVGGLVFRRPIPEGKPFAMAYRSMAEYFAALDECGLLEEFELRESPPTMAWESRVSE